MKDQWIVAKIILILTDKTNVLKRGILEVTDLSLDEIVFISFLTILCSAVQAQH